MVLPMHRPSRKWRNDAFQGGDCPCHSGSKVTLVTRDGPHTELITSAGGSRHMGDRTTHVPSHGCSRSPEWAELLAHRPARHVQQEAASQPAEGWRAPAQRLSSTPPPPPPPPPCPQPALQAHCDQDSKTRTGPRPLPCLPLAPAGPIRPGQVASCRGSGCPWGPRGP